MEIDDINELSWYNVREWGVEGKGWEDTERFFDRLPLRAKSIVRSNVWDLSRHSAGMSLQFETDAREIYARWTLWSERLAMPHMSATGVSGLDLYAQDDNGSWRWVGVGMPETAPQVEAKLVTGLEAEMRKYMIYLPLYNGVDSLEIGIHKNASFNPVPPRAEKPIVFYGTSIVHGASASRPGMCHCAILGRRLNVPIINLGFSGNGRMEIEVASFLAELHPSVYVIDCVPNTQAELIAERTEPLVQLLRSAHSDTPIVLVEDRTLQGSDFIQTRKNTNTQRRAALRNAYERLVSSGTSGLHYVYGEDLLGDDGEGTVDSSHPNDLGFFRMADALQPVLEELVK